MSVYISIDVEAVDWDPKPKNLLSIGCVAFDGSGVEVGGWYANLNPDITECSFGQSAAAFWVTHQEAFERTRVNPSQVHDARENLDAWLQAQRRVEGSPLVFVAWPAGYDFSFLASLLGPYARHHPFSCLDLKTLSAVLLERADHGFNYASAGKRNLRKAYPELFQGLPEHAHHALDDAREQGLLFFRMRSLLCQR